jgi:hypothetical protein
VGQKKVNNGGADGGVDEQPRIVGVCCVAVDGRLDAMTVAGGAAGWGIKEALGASGIDIAEVGFGKLGDVDGAATVALETTPGTDDINTLALVEPTPDKEGGGVAAMVPGGASIDPALEVGAILGDAADEFTMGQVWLMKDVGTDDAANMGAPGMETALPMGCNTTDHEAATADVGPGKPVILGRE